jgi:magnesium transporter
MKEFGEFKLTAEFRDRFQEAINTRDTEYILSTLEHIDPADITDLLYEFDSEESKYVLDLLDINVRSELIRELDPETRRGFVDV